RKRDEHASRCSRQEPLGQQRLKSNVTRGGVYLPQATRLREGQPESCHLAELTANPSHQHIKRQHQRLRCPIVPVRVRLETSLSNRVHLRRRAAHRVRTLGERCRLAKVWTAVVCQVCDAASYSAYQPSFHRQPW